MARVMLLTLEYPPQIGGVGKYLQGEVEASDAAVEVIRAENFFWRLWPKWLRLLWMIRRARRSGGCDYLWVSHLLPIGYVPLFLKIPFRLYLHGLDLVRPLKSPWKKFWARKILLSASEIIANSHATAKILRNYGIEPSRARVQYPRLKRIDAQVYKEAGKRRREFYNIADKPLLLTISRLVKRKGIDLVIAALPEIWRNIPDLVYVVAGEGEYEQRLSVETRHCLVSTRRKNDIIFTGAISDEEKYAWLSACDCFILTPRSDADDFEGYGIVYKEAQMFDKPVIGSRVGGVPEAVGEAGILVEPGNIEEIVASVIRVFADKLITNNQFPITKKDTITNFQNKPRVSIIIPVYNQYKKLVACLDSIKKQTFTDYEVIIVNDGSTDISQDELTQQIVKCQLSNVKCFYQPNAGAPAARNRGFAESKGKYVLFCDADIIMRPDMLAKMVSGLDNNPEVSYVYSSFKFGWKKFKLWEFDAEKLKQMPYIHATSLIRREHFSGFDPNLKRLQDWDLWLTMLEQGRAGKWIAEVLFTIKPGGTMSAWLPSFMTKFSFLSKSREYQDAVNIIKQKHRTSSLTLSLSLKGEGQGEGLE